MDEYLINISLQELKPSSLPWSTDGEEKKKNNSADRSTTPVDMGAFTSNDYYQLKSEELDAALKRQFSAGSRYVGFTSDVTQQNMGKIIYVKGADTSQMESKNIREYPTTSSPLSRKDVTQSSSEYCRKIPKLDTINNIQEKHGASPAAACLSECDTIIQSNRRKSPRCSLKVSRTIIQQTKLGYSVPLQSGRTLSDRKDQMSTGPGFILKKENDFKTKQIEQGQVYESLQGKCFLTKKLEDAASTSTASLKRVNGGILCDNPDTCRKSDLDIDNELDDLLKVTADAMNHGVKKNNSGNESDEHFKRQVQSKDAKNIHVANSTCKSKDNNRQNSSVSSISSSEGKVDDKVNFDVRCEYRNELKSLEQKALHRTCTEKDINEVECQRDEKVKLPEQRNVSKQRRDIEICIDGFGKYRGDTGDIKTKIDIIDGIGVESFDEKAQEPLPHKPKNIKQAKSQERSKGGAILETKTVHRNVRHTQLKDTKDGKAVENKSRSKDIRNVQWTKRHLVHKNDIGDDDDIFDISPVKNREILSDLEDDNTNIYDKRISGFLKRDERYELNRNGKIGVLCNNTLKPEQTQRCSLKDNSKRSKNEKKQKVKETKKENGVKLDNHALLKKQKKKKSKRLSKTPVKDWILSTENSARRNESNHTDVGRLSMKTNGQVPKTETSNTNSHVHKTDNEITHTVHAVDDKINSYQTRYRLKPAKSYTVIKHNRNSVTRNSTTMNNDHEIDKDRRGSRNSLVIYDSDKDSDMISDVQYQQYLTYRPPSEASHEFEFPKPASNRTFIIDSSSEDGDRIKSKHEETEHDIEQSNKEEKKLTKTQRFINFILCCFRPKTDH